MQIKNDWDMYSILSNVLVKVIKTVSEKVTYDLSQSILENTYRYWDGGIPNKYYVGGTGEPTYEFLTAFHFDEIVNNMKEVFSELFYDWKTMRYDPIYSIHGSQSYGDMREVLAEWLNTEGISGWMEKERKPYWDIFIEDEFANGKIKKYFDEAIREEFAKIGAIVN